VVQQDQWHFCSIRAQVPSPAGHSGLRDPALPLLGRRSQLWLRSNLWPGKSTCHGEAKKEKKKEKRKTQEVCFCPFYLLMCLFVDLILKLILLCWGKRWLPATPGSDSIGWITQTKKSGKIPELFHWPSLTRHTSQKQWQWPRYSLPGTVHLPLPEARKGGHTPNSRSWTRRQGSSKEKTAALTQRGESGCWPGEAKAVP